MADRGLVCPCEAQLSLVHGFHCLLNFLGGLYSDFRPRRGLCCCLLHSSPWTVALANQPSVQHTTSIDWVTVKYNDCPLLGAAVADAYLHPLPSSLTRWLWQPARGQRWKHVRCMLPLLSFRWNGGGRATCATRSLHPSHAGLSFCAFKLPWLWGQRFN